MIETASPVKGLLREALSLALLVTAPSLSAATLTLNLAGKSPTGQVAVKAELTTADRIWSRRLEAVISPDQNVASLDVPDLPTADVSVLLSAAGYWAEDTVWRARVSDHAVRLYRGAELRARLKTDTNPPADLQVKFRPLGTSEGEAPESSVSCPYRPTWSCRIPAGRFDLSIRMSGHVSHHLLDREIQPGEQLDLGSLTFRRGASVVGFVNGKERGTPDPAKCRILLAPAAARGHTNRDSREGIFVLTERPNGRGFFAFEGVPPGRYVVTATQEGFSRVSREVEVHEDAESMLKEPLQLKRPTELRLTILPPQDPHGRPWSVTLYEETSSGRLDRTTESSATLSGSWSRPALSNGGLYRISVKTSKGGDWWSDGTALELSGDLVEKTIDVSIERVAGRILVDAEPLKATLGFQPEWGVGSVIEVESDERGEFELDLPRLGKWAVQVQANAGSIRRKLETAIAKPPSGLRPKIEISLGTGSIAGEIVDEQGDAITENAMVSLRRGDSRELVHVPAQGGSFRFEALDPGDYTVSAEGAELVTDAESVRLDKRKQKADPLKLVARKVKSLRGIVTGPDGRPVMGAVIIGLAGTDFTSESTAPASTDVEGRFSLRVRPTVSEKCIAVIPPGFAARVLRLPVSDKEEQIPVDRTKGSLTVEVPEADPKSFSMLFHGGCFYSPIAFANRLPDKERRSKDGSREFVLHGIEPGPWSLCLVGHSSLGSYGGGRPGYESCKHGVLAAGSKLELKVAAPRQQVAENR